MLAAEKPQTLAPLAVWYLKILAPERGTLDESNWFNDNFQINLPIYLGNGFVVSPNIAIGKVGLFACR